MMTELEFQSLAQQGYNRIPLITEAFADLETPLSVYLKLAQVTQAGKNSFLLESVVGGERFGRYSFIGLPTQTYLRHQNGITEIIHRDQVIERNEDNPLDFLKSYQARFKAVSLPGMPRFTGGLAGYFAYDTVRFIEKKLAHTSPPDTLRMPDIQLLLTEELAVIDNLSGKLYLIVYANPQNPEAYNQARLRLRDLKNLLKRPVEAPITSGSVRTEVVREFAKTDFLKAVEQAKEYILAGDLMQVQIGQRYQKSFLDAPLLLYRALRSINPSPYMYFYNFGELQIVGASPEILVRDEQLPNHQRKMTIRPIAGTRPRGFTEEQDQALATELKNDPKEVAEHLMLIDLARNDIGRLAQTGTVKVTEQFMIEKYSHVQHIVSNVEGILPEGISNIDILKATFPAGTLTGAPKVRAMQIIDQLEPSRRGIYGGACGYLSFNGDMDLAIAIRTGIIKDGTLYVQASAGIVADSIPEAEWQETENKARAVLCAAEQVQDGLDQTL